MATAGQVQTFGRRQSVGNDKCYQGVPSVGKTVQGSCGQLLQFGWLFNSKTCLDLVVFYLDRAQHFIPLR